MNRFGGPLLALSPAFFPHTSCPSYPEHRCPDEFWDSSVKYGIVVENLDSPATVPKFESGRVDLGSLQHLHGVPASQRPRAEWWWWDSGPSPPDPCGDRAEHAPEAPRPCCSCFLFLSYNLGVIKSATTFQKLALYFSELTPVARQGNEALNWETGRRG